MAGWSPISTRGRKRKTKIFFSDKCKIIFVALSLVAQTTNGRRFKRSAGYSLDSTGWNAEFESCDTCNILGDFSVEEVQSEILWSGTRYEHGVIPASDFDHSQPSDPSDSDVSPKTSDDIADLWTSRSFDDGIAPKFKFGGNYGVTIEEIHWHHRLFQAFYLSTGIRKVNKKASGATLALWQDFYLKFSRYGCYCFTKGPVAKGEGTPRDGFDKACKNLMRCERCLTIDSDNGEFTPDTCEEHSGYTYKAKMRDDGMNGTEPYIHCHKSNSACQKRQCECDREYAAKAVSGLDLWDDSFLNVVDEAGVCEKNAVHIGTGGSDECCGDSPNRFPYHSGGQTQCCGTRFYNMATKQCCNSAESEVALSGSCP